MFVAIDELKGKTTSYSNPKVERTKKRPIAARKLNVTNSLISLSIFGSISLLILTKLKYRTIALGLGIVPMVLTYPICKRHTHFAQLVLGLAFNWGAVLGWSQSCSDSLIDLSKLLPLYIGSVLWTVMYDTVYGFQVIISFTRYFLLCLFKWLNYFSTYKII